MIHTDCDKFQKKYLINLFNLDEMRKKHTHTHFKTNQTCLIDRLLACKKKTFNWI